MASRALRQEWRRMAPLSVLCCVTVSSSLQPAHCCRKPSTDRSAGCRAEPSLDDFDVLLQAKASSWNGTEAEAADLSPSSVGLSSRGMAVHEQIAQTFGAHQATVNWLRSLWRLHAGKGDGGSDPFEFGPLLSNPRIISGLLAGDVTQPLVELSRETSAPLTNDYRTSNLLKAHSLMYNNIAAVVIMAVVCTFPLAGWMLDRRRGTQKLCQGSFTWQIGLLMLASYAIWIPAIYSEDFSFNIGFIVPLTGQRIGITQDEHDGHKPGPIHESTRTMIRLLWTTGAHLGAVLIAIYAFAVPFAKLLFLSVGELLRPSKWTPLVRVSRYSIVIMQLISKWAAPDMFAYVLLYYLIRKIEHLPISTLCVMDIGFTCYSVFTLTCALSSLGIPLPKLPGEEQQEVRAPWLLRTLGAGWFFALVCVLTTIWAVVFVIGVGMPCFALRLDEQLLKDHVPNNMKTVLRLVKLDAIVPPQDVSVWRACWAILGWFVSDHDLNLLLSFIMLAVFAVVLTFLDMAVLLLVGWQIWQRSKDVAPVRPTTAVPRALLGYAEALKHLSMMDVLIMGIIVCTLASAMYRRQGIVIYPLNGLILLFASEVMHYATYYSVRFAAEHYIWAAEKQEAKAKLEEIKAHA